MFEQKGLNNIFFIYIILEITLAGPLATGGSYPYELSQWMQLKATGLQFKKITWFIWNL